LEFPTSSEARDIVDEEGIVVIGYRSVPEAWSRVGVPG
jgi:hypothetical protein